MPKKTKTNDFILKARRRMRKSLAAEADRANSDAVIAARNAVHRAVTAGGDPTTRLHNAVVYATSQLGLAVLNSMNVNVPFTVGTTYQSRTGAQTDFRSIRVVVDPRAYNVDDIDAVARLIQFTKGLIYHEAGHILYSVPFRKLIELNGHTVDEFSLKHPNASVGDFAKAWNVLEDQRMECAMVRMSPIMRQYFSVIVQDFVVNKAHQHTAWLFTAGRTYIDKDQLSEWRAAANEHWQGIDDNIVKETASCVTRYKRATTAAEMLAIVVEFEAILRRWQNAGPIGDGNGGVDEHQNYNDPWNNKPQQEDWENKINQTTTDEEPPEDAPFNPSPLPKGKDKDKDDDKGDDDKPNTGSSSDSDDSDDSDESDASEDGDGDGDGDDAADAADDEKPNTSDKSKGKGDGGDEGNPESSPSESNERGVSSDGSMGEARDGSSGPAKKNSDIDDIMRQGAKDFLSTVNQEMGRTLPHNNSVLPMPDEDLVKTDEVYNGMLNALEPLATQCDPSWRFGQDSGVLDPTGYHLREPGDCNYWINLDDIGAQGYDLSVSVIVDVSYSMEDNTRNVGIAALGIRKACDNLGIPCSVSTFSGESHLLWDAEEDPTEVYPLTTGSTNPEGALDALIDQSYGKTRHLVVILTDGVWDHQSTLAGFNQPGRYFMVAGIGVPQHYLDRLGADMVISVRTPLELPPLVTNALAGYLA